MPNGTWTNLSGGNWNLNTNWSGSVIASGNDSSATFNLNITAVRTITLNANYTIAAISFADSGGAVSGQHWTLTRTLTNLLTLQSVLSDGIPTITSNVFTYILNGVIAGSNGFRKLGPETARFAATANPISGPLYVNHGSIQMGEHGSGIVNTLPNITEINILGSSGWSAFQYLGAGNFTETRPITGVNFSCAIYALTTNGIITFNTPSIRDFIGTVITYVDETLVPSTGIDFLTNFPVNSQLLFENVATSSVSRTATFKFSHDYPVVYTKDVFLRASSATSGGVGVLEVNTNSSTDFSGSVRRWTNGNSSLSTMTLQLAGTGTNCSLSGRVRNNSSGTASDGIVALSKAGSGTWVLSGDNDYTGNTSLTAGTLRVQSDTALGAPSVSSSSGSVTLSGGTLRLEGGNGNGIALDKGVAAITFGGSQIVVDAGTNENSLKCGPVGITGTNLTINVGTGSSFFLNNSGIISSADQGIRKVGDGDLILSTAANTFAGYLDINGGDLTLGSIANSGSGASWGAGTPPVKIPKNLKINGTGGTTNRPVMFVGSTPSIESAGSGAVTFSAISQGGGNRTITLKGDNAGDNTFSGPLKESGVYRVMGMNIARGRHASITLQNGKVLVLGGTNNTSALNSCELYDPATDSWSMTGAMFSARWYCDDNAVLLNNGKVLVVGAALTSAISSSTQSCELYNPSLGTWSTAASISTARTNVSVVKLNDGRVLTTGGIGPAGYALTVSQIYTQNEGTGTWATNTPSFTEGRYHHTTTLMSNGSVLLVGGWTSSVSLNTFQVFDPAGGAGAGSWSLSSTFSADRRYGHIAVPILGGTKILIAGGAVNSNITGNTYSSCLTYDVSGGGWSTSVSPMNVKRYRPTYQVLSDGRVLVAGGWGNDGLPLSSIEIYNPVSDTWTLLSDSLSSVAGWVTSSMINLPGDSRILFSGGYNTSTTVTNICSTYNPSQTLALTKSGTGKWILGGSTLSYSGITALEAGTLDLGGTSRVLSGGITMSGGTLQNGSATLESDVTVTGGTGSITAQLAGTSILTVSNGTVTVSQPDSNLYTGGTLINEGTTLKAITAVDPSAVPGGKVLGDGTVTVSGTLKTGSSSTQRGQLKYGGTLTFNGGSKIYLGGA